MKPSPIYHKLVRDNIPHILESEGWTVFRDIASTIEEKAMALSYKLAEELREIETATDSKQLLEEVADLWSVILAIDGHHVKELVDQKLLAYAEAKVTGYLAGSYADTLREIVDEKLEKKGGFKILLIITIATPPEPE